MRNKERKSDEDPYLIADDVHSAVTEEFSCLLENLRSNVIGDYAASYLQKEYLSKFNGKGTATADERRRAAIDKWQRAELRNRATNQRLLIDEANFGFATSDMILETARGYVRETLGPLDIDTIFDSSMYSNGASTRVKRGHAAIAQKFMGRADVTEKAWGYFERELEKYPGWISLNPELVRPNFVNGNVLFTVPKNSEIDRVACKEPEVNMWLQKGVGDHIRMKLKERGINLDDQRRNQKLARIGSKDGTLATLDLSSASDLISIGLVVTLLPPEWFVLLNDLRSETTRIGNELHELHMFSSMGNGFTFELESLLFWCICRSINFHLGVRGTVSVYGDDLITPTKAAKVYGRIFSFFGFIVNPKKSFWRGRFRESCGAHWYAGTNVTPFYVKEPIAHQSRLIHFLNRLRAWGSRFPEFDEIIYPFYIKWSKLVDKRFHGGKDVALITSLATPGAPRLKLVRVQNERSNPAMGAMLHWLRGMDLFDDPKSEAAKLEAHAARIILPLKQTAEDWDIEEIGREAFITSRAFTEGRYVVRRNAPWERDLRELFLSELLSATSRDVAE